MSRPGQSSIAGILRWRAETQPDRIAYRFLVDGEFEEAVITYKQLDQRARSIAAVLQCSVQPADRVLLLLPAGLDFIAAFYGCLYAKVIAVPACPPHPARIDQTLPTILGTIADAAPAIALVTSPLFRALNSRRLQGAELGNIKLLVTEAAEWENEAEQWKQPAIESNDIAFLQYTSGSTTMPRGVIVNHRNLLHNLSLIEKSFGQSSESHAVIWLPPYHDMGLIGGILQPLFSGYPSTLIPHLMFLQRPYRWLQAISRFRATTSGGPNFAYDLCIRKIRPEQRTQLDLSGWNVAFNGSEQVYHKTLDKFTEYFAPCGFTREAFVPCYGLAEATLMVWGGPKGRIPVIRHLVPSGLVQNQAILSTDASNDRCSLVSCGQNLSDQEVRIVDAETLTLCAEGKIGEIWVKGNSVAEGYWNKPEETEHTFGARLADSQDGPFLRTGDLGFVHEGELYITGRLKNLIISEGKNHYPQDIERTVEGAHPAIRPAGCAVFSIEKAEGEGIIILVEIEHNLIAIADEIIKAIQRAVSLQHELRVEEIRLTAPGGIPRTTSGKIKHFQCKKVYLAETLKERTSI